MSKQQIKTIGTTKEQTAAEEHPEVAEIRPEVTVGTHRAVPPSNQKTREDNGGEDPTIVNKVAAGSRRLSLIHI